MLGVPPVSLTREQMKIRSIPPWTADTPEKGTRKRHWGENSQARMGQEGPTSPFRCLRASLGAKLLLQVNRGAKPCPLSLGQRGVEQAEGSSHQVQAASDQDTDRGCLPQQHSPTAGRGVGVSPRGCRGCQMGVSALCDPPQSLGQAREHEGWGIEGSWGWGHQEQGASGRGRLQQTLHPQGRWEPGVLPHFLLQEPCPCPLVLQAASQGVLQRHIEVLLVWEGWGQQSGIAGEARGDPVLPSTHLHCWPPTPQ